MYVNIKSTSQFVSELHLFLVTFIRLFRITYYRLVIIILLYLLYYYVFYIYLYYNNQLKQHNLGKTM